MFWGLALQCLSALLNPTPEFISQPWWTQRQPGSILYSLFFTCLPTDLQGGGCSGWFASKAKVTHFPFWKSVCTLWTCIPICKTNPSIKRQ